MPSTTAFAATTRRRFGSASSVGTIEPCRASSVYDRMPSTTTKIGTITIISANPGSVVSATLDPKCIVATIAHAASPASVTAPASSPYALRVVRSFRHSDAIWFLIVPLLP